MKLDTTAAVACLYRAGFLHPEGQCCCFRGGLAPIFGQVVPVPKFW